MKELNIIYVLILLILAIIIHIGIKDLKLKYNKLEKEHEETLDYLYQYKHEIDSLQQLIKHQQWTIDVTNEECTRLRKSNIQYRIQLR